MSEKKLKTILSHKLPKREQAEASEARGGFIKTGRPATMPIDSYLAKYATAEEKAELVKRIEERRAKLPKFVYRICDSCGYKNKTQFGDRDIYDPSPEYCFGCNLRRYTDGAVLREMTKKEAREYEAKEDAREIAAKERTLRAGFFKRNQEREAAGLLPLTLGQFKEERKKEYRQLIRDSRGGQKR